MLGLDGAPAPEGLHVALQDEADPVVEADKRLHNRLLLGGTTRTAEHVAELRARTCGANDAGLDEHGVDDDHG